MRRKNGSATGADDRPVALVTGGGRRIGAAIVRALAGAGFRVVLTFRESREAAGALADATGGAALRLDLRRPESFPAFADRFRRAFGRLDALVHNAAVFPRTPVGEVTAAAWDEAFAVNTRAPFLLTQAFLPLLREASAPPAVVFLGDAGAGKLWPSYIPYCLSKVAAEAEARALKAALAPAVRVGLVRPGLALRADDFPEARWNALRERPGRSRIDSPGKAARAVASFVNRGRGESHILKA
jgi:pteridine reductase